MDFDLSPDHELIRRTVREFAEGEVAPVAEELDRTKAFPYEIVAKLGELGLMGIPFPEDVGGAGGDSLAYAIAVEELARVDSSVAITMCAHTSLGTQPIYLFGSAEQQAEWLPELTAGRKLGAFGLTEPEAGSDAGNVRTRARLDGGEWVDRRRQAVHHQRRHRHLRRRLHHRAHRRGRDLQPDRAERDAGLLAGRAVPQDGLERVGHAPARVRGLPRARGEPARAARRRLQAVHARSSTSAASAWRRWASASPRARSTRRSPTRRSGGAFGKPISKFQAIQGKLADMATEIEAARLLTYKAALLKDPGRSFTLTAAQAKLKTGRLAVRCSEEAVQIHGGYGYIEEYPVCRFYRDAKILTIGEGTDEVQQMVIARALGA